MHLRNSLPVLCLILFVLFLPQPALGQMFIPHDLLGNGSGSSSGVDLRIEDSLGESVIGIMTGAAIIHEIGYRFVTDAFFDSVSTAVAISAFSATFTGSSVELVWEIAVAEELEGFNVYRAENRDGVFMRLNETLIPADHEYSYQDTHLQPGATYLYRLGAVDRDGEFFSQDILVEVPFLETTLHQNRPNPFNPSTVIPFYLSEPAHVQLSIYDVRGKRVRTLLDANRSFGKHEVMWNGRDNRGNPVSSGVYYYRLKTGQRILTKKLTLLK